MLLAFVTLLAAFQTAPVAPQPPSPPAVIPVSAPAPTPAPAPPAAPTPAPEPEAEPEEAAPATRQVCRYVEVSGQRFPVRTCRTVPVRSDDR